MRVSVLRAELAKRHLPNVGRKLELFNRLQQACLEEEAATTTTDTDTDTAASPIENKDRRIQKRQLFAPVTVPVTP